MENPQDHNLEVFLDGKVARSYTWATDLTHVEKLILDELQKEIKEGDRILDLGVGTGRTTPHLRQLSSNYVGVDYSAAMIDLARKNFPEGNFSVGDVRDLSSFKDQEFDLVFFSFNGLDYVGHEDRLKALEEIKRVLKPSKLFVFSSHNMRYRHFDKLRLKYTGDLPRYVFNSIKSIYNRIKNKKDHIYSGDYAIVTDPGHGYRLLTYYVLPTLQVKQLVAAGFSGETKILDLNGNPVSDSPDSAWLYYLTRRA